MTTVTTKQEREVNTALRHIGRAMKALERASLPTPRVGEDRWAWLLDHGHRTLLEASDKLIDGMEAATITLPSSSGDPL